MKYRPNFPSPPFASLTAAHAWVERLVAWYNSAHLNCGIRFATPEQHHAGADVGMLAERDAVYAKARERHPERWSGTTKNWSHIQQVSLTNDRRQHDRGGDNYFDTRRQRTGLTSQRVSFGPAPPLWIVLAKNLPPVLDSFYERPRESVHR